jgi:predicted membrane-bound dolichyl-phosphate-mannose-protein mannosyltransferase
LKKKKTRNSISKLLDWLVLILAGLSFLVTIFFLCMVGGENWPLLIPSMGLGLMKIYEMDYKKEKKSRTFWVIYWCFLVMALVILVGLSALFWVLSHLPPGTVI